MFNPHIPNSISALHAAYKPVHRHLIAAILKSEATKNFFPEKDKEIRRLARPFLMRGGGVGQRIAPLVLGVAVMATYPRPANAVLLGLRVKRLP